MQPYFFPYAGYIKLMVKADFWIVFDPVQYIRKGWMSRNRILHPTEGWQYITAPVKKHSREDLITDIEVKDGGEWKERILRQLEHYRGKAPHYKQTVEFVRECLDRDEPKLSRLNALILEDIARYLGFKHDWKYFSEMNLELGPINGPGDWALEMSRALNAEEYINPPGGRDIFDADAFAKSDIKLTIQEYQPLVYDCGPYEHVPGLSIVDVLMWNDLETVREHLEIA